MAEASIPVDLFNPGQVFACLGLVEAAEVLLGGAVGAFDWRDAGAVRFRVRAAGDEDPVARVLRFLAVAEVSALVPHGSALEHAAVPFTQLPAGAPFPFPEPGGAQPVPALLTDESHEIVVDHWGDATERDAVKFWGGMAGYPGAAVLRDAIDLVRTQLPAAAADPFSLSAPQSSSFRLDWRKDYVPMDAGFSLNKHAQIETLGYPLVEVLAVIGLTHARPDRVDRRDKLRYRYAVVGVEPHEPDRLLRPALLRAVLGGTDLPFPRRTFRMNLTWPGQEGQARSITTVTEETSR